MSDNVFTKAGTRKVDELPNENHPAIEQFNQKQKEIKEQAKQLQEHQIDIANEQDIPKGYIRINLCGEGKLSLPKIVHIRNFTTEEVLELSSISDPSYGREVLCKIMSDIVYEDIFATLMTDNELIEIVILLYANYYGDTIREYDYPLTDSDVFYLRDKKPEKYEEFKNGKYHPKIDIPIANLSTLNLPKEFKEPITFTNEKDNRKVAIRLPRIKDELECNKYIQNKYSEMDKKFYIVAQTLEREKVTGELSLAITEQDRKDYKEHLRKKFLDNVKTLLTLTLVSFDGKPLNTLEEKLEASTNLEFNAWIEMNEFLNSLKWGFNEEINVISPITGKSETRRFSFRVLEILKSTKHVRTKKYSISFG